MLEFAGRADRQIKLRGVRMELSSIEAALLGCDGVSQAVVVVDGGSEATKRLVAYATPSTVDSAATIAALRERLPAAMVPSLLVPLVAMPLNHRGKIDRKSLPAPPSIAKSLTLATGHATASDDVEAKIAQVWADVLGLEPGSVPVDVHFELLGGNSLAAGRVTAKLRKSLAVNVDGTILYRHPTIRAVAKAVRAECRHGAADEQHAHKRAPFDRATDYKGQ